MKKMSILLAAGLLSSAAGTTMAAVIANGTSGLSGPGVTTITFDDGPTVDNQVITNQYAGATFFTTAPGGEGTIYQYGNQAGPLGPGGDAGAFINFDIGNGGPNGTRRTNAGETVIQFSSNVTGATLQIAGQADGGTGNVRLIAALNGSPVAQVTGPIDFDGSTHNDFFGFTGITFNQILITPRTSDNALIGDNLSFTVAPEPTSLAAITLGAGALVSRRRR